MLEVLITTLNKWHATKSERQKLQSAYLALTAATILLAGVTSLFSASAGHNVAQVALAALGAFLLNAIVWSLLQTSLLDRLSSKPKRRP